MTHPVNWPKHYWRGRARRISHGLGKTTIPLDMLEVCAWMRCYYGGNKKLPVGAERIRGASDGRYFHNILMNDALTRSFKTIFQQRIKRTRETHNAVMTAFDQHYDPYKLP